MLVAAGRTSDVYEFGHGSVVKVARPDVPDHWAVLEAEYTAAVRTVGVPAPLVIDVIIVDGRNAIVFERIDGRSMWEHMVAEPARIPELAETLAATQRLIFAAGPPVGLEGFVDRMCRKIDEVDSVPATERSDARRLAESQPKGAALLHGDLHPGNVLITPDGPVVIDWFDASIGHPIADIVRSSILMRPVADLAGPHHLPGAEMAMLATVHDAYVDTMADLLVGTPEVLHGWEALSALSRLSEGDQPDAQALVDLWQRRNEPVMGPLFGRVNRQATRSPIEAPD